MAQTLIVRSHPSPLDYRAVWRAMQDFTTHRETETPDELWLLEHTPVYTQGQAGKPEHLLQAAEAPIVQSDRGGQITWHGPGQLMIYTLLDTRRRPIGAKALVNTLENALITVLAALGVAGHARTDAPGVYVTHNQQEAKLAAIGLRFRKTGCYHGAALNLHCTLEPYRHINPCGYAGQPVTRLCDLLTSNCSRSQIEPLLIQAMKAGLGYHTVAQAAYHA